MALFRRAKLARDAECMTLRLSVNQVAVRMHNSSQV